MLLLLAEFVAGLIGYCSPWLESYFNIQHDSLKEQFTQKMINKLINSHVQAHIEGYYSLDNFNFNYLFSIFQFIFFLFVCFLAVSVVLLI